MVNMTNNDNILKLAKAVIKTEMQAIENLQERIDENFVSACEALLACKGRIAVLGMGKSGHIAKKIAATLASTGTPAFYVHPSEASHGDLGMMTSQDLVLAVSYSGETPEVINILPMIKRLGATLIAITGKPQSALGRTATVCIDVGVDQEACPLGLAPTSSTTATLVMGDALAIALLDARGFTADDFARNHPGGSLGRRLLLHIEDLMHTHAEMPQVTPDTRLDKALLEITQKSLGMTTIIDNDGELIGVFTDGDLRRTLDKGCDIHKTLIRDVMTAVGVTVPPKLLAAEALKMMQDRKITSLVVTDEKQSPLGVVHMHDLLRAGVL